MQDNGEPADDALKTWITVVPPEPPPYLLLIDEDSIDNGNPPNFFSAREVNDHIAKLALRTPLPAFDVANVGRTYTLHTGQVGDEGWFAPKRIPAKWNAAGPTADGKRNFVGNPRQPYPHNVGPGLGTRDAKGDRESLLDKIPDVTPLRATALGMLAERAATVCAVVYDSNRHQLRPAQREPEGGEPGHGRAPGALLDPAPATTSGSLPELRGRGARRRRGVRGGAAALHGRARAPVLLGALRHRETGQRVAPR